ncbi:MAG: efflux RND transporter periplasmic adaptor subunit [Proteobacteria bacterium]|nr:efflux RND transporter periplasmic adaptor subunit [Pseudomonadota bacterium]
MKKTFLLITLAALAIGAGYFWWQGRNTEGRTGQTPMNMPALEVAALKLEPRSISLKRQLPGRISAYRLSQVRPQVDGIITERLFEEGGDIEKGQQLYQIDDARYKAALNSAKADLSSARASVKSVKAKTARYADLVKIDAVSRQEYDDVRAQLDQANAAIAVAAAAVDVATVNLDYTKVYAPISGRISRSFVTEGALVTANQSQNLATITQLNPVYVDMQQSGEEALQLRSLMADKETVPVSIHLEEDGEKGLSYHGQLKFSEVTIDETTGSITLRALVDNPDGILLPGLFARAELDLGQVDVLLVPQRAATRTAEGGLDVWVVNSDNKAQKRSIVARQAYQDGWVVDSGLKAGDLVIVEGYQKLSPDMQVNPVAWNKGGLAPMPSENNKNPLTNNTQGAKE